MGSSRTSGKHRHRHGNENAHGAPAGPVPKASTPPTRNRARGNRAVRVSRPSNSSRTKAAVPSRAAKDFSPQAKVSTSSAGVMSLNPSRKPSTNPEKLMTPRGIYSRAITSRVTEQPKHRAMGASVLAKTLEAVRAGPPPGSCGGPAPPCPHTTATIRHAVGSSRSTARPRGRSRPSGAVSDRGGSCRRASCSRRYMGPKSRPVRATRNTSHSISRA